MSMISFDYGFSNTSAYAVPGIIQTNKATLSPVTLSSAGEYTCTVSVTASGVCEGGPDCPAATSDPISLEVLCKCMCVCVHCIST